MRDLYWRACWPIHPVDGDTVDLLEDNGRREYAIRRERLLGINTPELHAADPTVRAKAVEAAAYVGAWFAAHAWHNLSTLSWPVVDPVRPFAGYAEVPYFVLRSEKPDSFDRWLSRIECQAGHSLNQDLLDAGLAVPFKGG